MERDHIIIKIGTILLLLLLESSLSFLSQHTSLQSKINVSVFATGMLSFPPKHRDSFLLFLGFLPRVGTGNEMCLTVLFYPLKTHTTRKTVTNKAHDWWWIRRYAQQQQQSYFQNKNLVEKGRREAIVRHELVAGGKGWLSSARATDNWFRSIRWLGRVFRPQGWNRESPSPPPSGDGTKDIHTSLGAAGLAQGCSKKNCCVPKFGQYFFCNFACLILKANLVFKQTRIYPQNTTRLHFVQNKMYWVRKLEPYGTGWL